MGGKYWLRTVLCIVLGLVRIAASLAFVAVSKLLIDIATGACGMQINSAIWLLIAVMAVQILAGVGQSYIENVNTIRTRNELTFRVFANALRSAWGGREKFHSADTVNRLEEDVRVVVDLLCTRIPDIIITLCQLAAASVYLVTMAPELMWILVLIMVVAASCSKLFFKTTRRLTDAIRRKDSLLQQHMQENLQNRVLALTLIGAERVLSRLGILQKENERLMIKRLDYTSFARALMWLGFRAGYAAALIWGVLGIRGGTVTFGMMTAFLQLVAQVQMPISDLTRHIPSVIHSLTSRDRIKELLDLPQEDGDDGVLLEKAPSIEVQNLSFAYPDQKEPVLKNFSYTFEAGKMTLVEGKTGIGKSTLIRLVLGLLKPSEGTITVFSRRNYMYVPQGNSLMSGTVRENLLLAAPSATQRQMEDALGIAAADFVFDLPDGLDTLCGEDGTGLSEGQCQRIAIARAILHEGSILILDESTSALDSETEALLMTNLARYCSGRKTIIFISHRESATGYADAVLKL